MSLVVNEYFLLGFSWVSGVQTWDLDSRPVLLVRWSPKKIGADFVRDNMTK